jgi:hypothetical protein
MAVLLCLYMFLQLVVGASMAGTNAAKLRRPRIHRGGGYLATKPHVAPSVEDAVAAARRYRVAFEAKRAFNECLSASSTAEADECAFNYVQHALENMKVSKVGAWGM